MSWATKAEINVTALCNECNWTKDVVASRFNDPNLTECFVFKTCPKCPKCRRLLEFRSPKFATFQKVQPLHPKDVDFIMKSYLNLYSVLSAKSPPPYNFERKCAVGTKIAKKIPLEPSELSYLYGVKEPFEFHHDLDCIECKKVHNSRAVYLEENTGNVVKMFMDNTGVVGRLLSYLRKLELSIIPNGGECVICLDAMNDVPTCRRCDKCEQQYHVECIQKWLKKNKSCPHCRQSLENTVVLFFALSGRFYSFFEEYYKRIDDDEYYNIGNEDSEEEEERTREDDEEEDEDYEEADWITDDEEQYRENFLEEGADEMERRAEEVSRRIRQEDTRYWDEEEDLEVLYE